MGRCKCPGGSECKSTFQHDPYKAGRGNVGCSNDVAASRGDLSRCHACRGVSHGGSQKRSRDVSPASENLHALEHHGEAEGGVEVAPEFCDDEGSEREHGGNCDDSEIGDSVSQGVSPVEVAASSPSSDSYDSDSVL